MEQAVNQFNKGLLSDTHPMVLGNDTLSDALNATFVTMNGNEVVLQNDMGNRRVDNAFLPPGYEPVGIKEYGGIIYVASYNPITGRSLIGSFPSPERKINSLDDESLGCKFNLFDDFYDPPIDADEKVRFIKSDTMLYPLTGETSLHAGDKFAIYSNVINNWKEYLTNYNNTEVREKIKKAIHLKNKHLTLSIGILNSLNLFVDITKNLKRWNNLEPTNLNPDPESEEIKYDDTYSENYIFNDGYFISRTGFNDPSLYTKNDRELIRERLVNPTNTYAYKLVGPLYLKSQLNHILEFSYNISGDKGKNIIIEENLETGKNEEHEYDYINLEINTIIKYNCPDYVFKEGNENENYFDDGCGSPIKNFQGWEPFKFFRKKSTGEYVPYSGDNIEKSYTYGTPTYDNGLYTVNVKLKLKDKKYTKDINGKLEYFIGVDSGIPVNQTKNINESHDNNPYFIETLSPYGTIDLSKLNSGEVYLNYFRFFNNIDESDNSNNSTTISLGIEAYPKLNLKFTNFKLSLNDVENEDSEIMIDISDVLYNGKIVKTINWNNYNIEKGKLYEILSFEYDDNLDPGLQHIIKKDTVNDHETRWLLTTKLFNDCYNPLSNNFVEDFGERVYDPNGILPDNFTDKQKEDNLKLYNKLAIKLEISTDKSSVNVELLKEIKEGNLIEKSDSGAGSIAYIVKKNYIVTKSLTDKIVIKNPELYLNFILLENNSIIYNSNNITVLYPLIDIFNKNNGEITVIDTNNDEMFINPYARAISRGGYNELNASGLPIFTENISSSSKDIKILITCYNIIHSPKDGNKNFKNGFAKINSDYFRDYVLSNSTSHSGFFVTNFDHYSNNEEFYDEHHIGLVCDYPYLSIPTQRECFSKMTHSHCIKQEAETVFNFGEEHVSNFYDAMNSSISPRYTFAYIFSAINISGRIYDDDGDDLEDPQTLAYLPNFYANATTGLRKGDYYGEGNTVTEEASISGYCPITSCKVWWRNGVSENWVLLNSKTGLFGATDSSIQKYKFPFRDSDNKFFYVGAEEWESTEYNRKYLDVKKAKELYNNLYFEIKLSLSSSQNNSGESSNSGGGSGVHIPEENNDDNESPSGKRYRELNQKEA